MTLSILQTPSQRRASKRSRDHASRILTRQARLADQVANAPTPEARLNAAFDWFRCSSARMRKPAPTYRHLRAQAMAATDEVTSYLVRAAEELDRAYNAHHEARKNLTVRQRRAI